MEEKPGTLAAGAGAAAGAEVWAAHGAQLRRGWPALAVDYVALTKPGIVLLLVLTAYAAMLVASDGLPPLGTVAWTLAGLALSAGGANAVNMWYDRDIDRVMARTRNRPVPSGRLGAEQALAFGVLLGALAFALMAWRVGWLAAGLTLAGYLYYVFIYTMWLKRRTPQNIVIGGGAGAFPPLVGWAAVTGSLALPAMLMFLVIFLWTPPHFWSLSLYKQEDYRRAGIPMMPVARGERRTKAESLFYTLALVAASLAMARTGTVGPLYTVVAAVLGALFVALHVPLWRESSPEAPWARKTFRYSLVYLTLLFAALVVSHVVGV
ncbi:MAG: heme o synthase [Firmicutes bacterium]|nr:heme o synthase [Bacillota bacterium]